MPVTIPPRAGRRLAALAALAVIATPLAAQPGRAQDRRPTLAVLNFDNSALVRSADYAPLSKGMADLLITELANNTGIRVVERDQIQKILDEQNLSAQGRVDQETLVRLGKILGAHHMITGGFLITPKEEMRIDVRSFNTETSQIEYVETVTGKADDILGLIAQLSQKLNKGIKLPQLEARVGDAGSPSGGNTARPGGDATPSSGGATTPASSGATKSPITTAAPTGQSITHMASTTKGADFRAALLMSRAIDEADKKNNAQAVALYKQALDANPNFDRARVRLAALEKTSKGTN